MSCIHYQQPAEYLSEDFPQVSQYLQTVSMQAPAGSTSIAQPSQHSQNTASENLTSALIESVRDIMERAEIAGTDPDQELHQAVTRAVLEGVVAGYQMSESSEDSGERNRPSSLDEATASKRSRTDEHS